METSKYKLVVDAGSYEADSLVGLLIEMLRHRWWHLRMYGEWMD